MDTSILGVTSDVGARRSIFDKTPSITISNRQDISSIINFDNIIMASATDNEKKALKALADRYHVSTGEVLIEGLYMVSEKARKEIDDEYDKEKGRLL